MTVTFRKSAMSEFLDSMMWYESQRKGLGREFEIEIEHVIQRICTQPDRYPLIESLAREAPVNRFPYCVIYRVHRNRITIISVFHQSRNPKIWQRRLGN